MWQIGDLHFEGGVLTPPASWNRVQFPEAEPVEAPLTFGECVGCGATIGAGEPMTCDDCAGERS